MECCGTVNRKQLGKEQTLSGLVVLYLYRREQYNDNEAIVKNIRDRSWLAISQTVVAHSLSSFS